MEAGSGVNTIITFIGDMDNPSDAILHFNNFGFHLIPVHFPSLPFCEGCETFF